MSRVNVAGLRFIADTIEMNGNFYTQQGWGQAIRDAGIAGSGTSCGTPACVAGFTVQFLGDREGYEMYFRNAKDNRYSLIEYASVLLGLTREWAGAIFLHGEWPLHWVYEPGHEYWKGCSSLIREHTPSHKLHLTTRKFGDLIPYEAARAPTHQQAATFLRRLADQFEAEQGVNMNKDAPITAEVYA